ncbi:proline/glycine betaine ABC transporter ATP-binding protein [Companilactobacillus crustorum]|uniref:ABC-type quaternary amine transporter n=3 Tax=Companilactobacillus TaxID=2767879 RepID=A0A837RG95_9LACO|nr:ABC transporter ATP-binding protein [Companilactobacillus crustorum]HCD07136.1 ABC transporter ATP-binding protein [Lactobacillus sp.]APU71729.1 Glycine betaine/carnitine/choline transport ATP-binding protein OpuCA [Companilactobacillus crustorum]KRK40732.1 ABC-type proline glycine betaine transport system, ATPase component [Companilactobacillus crustorum JCM 15951]KRO17109.1 ABC-type proline glycine betaine transport system, ATPase component [Companilactobacillus crustorum]WDT66248.1 ABC t
MIKFEHVYKQYEGNSAIEDLNMEINDGDFFVMVGTSGSGKTTTLKMINRLIEPSTGKILIDGQDIKKYNLRKMRLNMGYVLQNIALFPNLTIEENITIQPDSLRWSKEKRKNTAWDLLQKVGLDPKEYAKRYPHELSGGEQQRVGIVRALATKPKMVLMDEPFSALDPISRRQLQDLVLKLHRELRTTFIFVTHDMSEAIRLGNTIAVLSKGHLEQLGNRDDILNHPKNKFVEGFFKLEKNGQDTVNLMLDSGLGQTSDLEINSSLLKEDTINTLATELKEHNGKVVFKKDGNNYLLTTSDLIDFLAEEEDN